MCSFLDGWHDRSAYGSSSASSDSPESSTKLWHMPHISSKPLPKSVCSACSNDSVSHQLLVLIYTVQNCEPFESNFLRVDFQRPLHMSGELSG